MQFQYSAGGVVYRKEAGEVSILVSQHSGHHGWVFPKGFIGDQIKGESKEQTALREVKEETGIEGKIVSSLQPTTYWFKIGKDTIKKTVYYFLMEYTGGNIEEHDDEMENVEWLVLDQVAERLTYPSDKRVWEVALRAINRRLKAQEE